MLEGSCSGLRAESAWKRSEVAHSTEKIEDECAGRGQMTVNMVLVGDTEYIFLAHVTL